MKVGYFLTKILQTQNYTNFWSKNTLIEPGQFPCLDLAVTENPDTCRCGQGGPICPKEGYDNPDDEPDEGPVGLFDQALYLEYF